MLDAGGPPVLVDLSNVCRDPSLCGPGERASLEAFRRLGAALQDHPGRFGPMRAIADRSLFRLLTSDDKREFRRLVSAGMVVESRLADDKLMEAAFSDSSPVKGAVIVSRDGFADFRLEYPEIQGSRDRFMDWVVQPNGRLVVRFRDMGEFTHMRISRKIEEGEFKERRILRTDLRDRAVHRRYRCTSSTCVQAQLWPDWLPHLPEYDRTDDSFHCPGCGSTLADAGERPKAVQIVVFADGDESCRLLLEEGDDLAVGREDGTGCIGLRGYVGDDFAAEISRKHLGLRLQGGVVEVEDLGSKNGSWIETRKGKFERRRLENGDRAPLGRSKRVRISSDVTLELSGRDNPFDGVRLDDRHTRVDVASMKTLEGG